MRLWISKNSEVPLREQLTTQIMLGIVSNDLKSNEKLPSTRELARRFRIHSNTISAAYRDLAKRGWVEFRRGSGVYVRERSDEREVDKNFALDHLISEFLKNARNQGFSLKDIQTRLQSWLQFQIPDHFLVIETDTELRRIIMMEINAATNFPVIGVSPDECTDQQLFTGAIPLSIYGRVDENRAAVNYPNYLPLHTSSIQQGYEKAKLLPPNASIVVVSHWLEFLRWGRATMVAGRLDSTLISFRNAYDDGWQEGLTRNNTFVVTDIVTSKSLPANCRHLVFHIIAESSLLELRNSIKNF